MDNPFRPVTLNDAELRCGAEVGLRRSIESRHVPDSEGMDYNCRWTAHIEGACGELAFAKFLNKYPTGAFHYRSEDDVAGYEVRTRPQHWMDLLVRHKDADHKATVCVTGFFGDYRIWGWMWSHEAKQSQWLKDPTGKRPPQFFVPKVHLHPFKGWSKTT
jgi:hypothetical protein